MRAAGRAVEKDCGVGRVAHCGHIARSVSWPGGHRILIAASLFAGIAPATADLLLYEPFDYPAGTKLEGAGSDGNGFVGSWSDHGSTGALGSPPMGHSIEADDSSLGNIWAGIPAGGLPNLGLFCMGERRDDNSGSRSIDPAVAATFVDGTVTWTSWVSAHTNDGAQPDNHHKPNLAIGQGPLQDNRADNAAGQAIGGGAHKLANGGGVLSATYWDDEGGDGTFEEHRSQSAGASLARIIPQQLLVMKIEWGTDAGTTDTVSLANFDISTDAGYTAPTEAAFDASAVSITSADDLDQSTFDTISFHGSRSSFDEIRLGTTFDDVVNGTEVGGGGKPGFSITEVSRNPDGSATITWPSRPGVDYMVFASSNLVAWEELDDAVRGEPGDRTSFTEEVVAGGSLQPDTPARYYRVTR